MPRCFGLVLGNRFTVYGPREAGEELLAAFISCFGDSGSVTDVDLGIKEEEEKKKRGREIQCKQWLAR
jgi:hypothetical protein